MYCFGARSKFPQNDGRTQLGFEYNHGSKYGFNFAQAEDDILAPKTSVRGNPYETCFTHRINRHLVSRSTTSVCSMTGTDRVGMWAPKKLTDTLTLGFPTYDMNVNRVAGTKVTITPSSGLASESKSLDSTFCCSVRNCVRPVNGESLPITTGFTRPTASPQSCRVTGKK